MHAPAAPPLPVPLLLQAYRAGVFPMADGRDDTEVFWVEPRERAILPLDAFHMSRSLRKVLARDRFEITCDQAFGEIIRHCAAPRPDQPDSWISRRIEASYLALHRAGHAHSIECWLNGELAGGLYGVAFDRVFCGESMFSLADNASKVALAWLVAAMRRAAYLLLDCQFITGHLATLGAQTISQREYRELVAAAGGSAACSIPAAIASLQAAGAPVSAGAPEPSSSPGKLIAQSFTQTS